MVRIIGLKDTVDSSAMIIESSQPVDMEEMSVNEMVCTYINK